MHCNQPSEQANRRSHSLSHSHSHASLSIARHHWASFVALSPLATPFASAAQHRSPSPLITARRPFNPLREQAKTRSTPLDSDRNTAAQQHSNTTTQQHYNTATQQAQTRLPQLARIRADPRAHQWPPTRTVRSPWLRPLDAFARWRACCLLQQQQLRPRLLLHQHQHQHQRPL